MSIDPTAASTSATAPNRGRLQTLGPIIAFDVAGPLAVYYLLRSSGVSTIPALILSGVVPAFGIALSVVRTRSLDGIGVLVLLGIITGSVCGLISRSAHAVLLEGVVPTAVFGAVCLGSLWSRRPMIFRFALEGMGSDTPKGRAFADRWRYPGFRHAFRVITIVWGVMFLLEAATQAVIVQTAPVSVAKLTSNVLILGFAAVVIAWNVAYAKRGQRQGELADAARRERGEAPPPMPD